MARTASRSIPWTTTLTRPVGRPSSIGKEPVILLGLGTVAYGGAKLLRGDLHGLLITTVGMTSVAMVRPHVALIAISALVAAVVVGGSVVFVCFFSALGNFGILARQRRLGVGS